jgi:hypothetical protein
MVTAIITIIMATTVNNIAMRFFMHYLLLKRAGLVSPAALTNATILASVTYRAHHAIEWFLLLCQIC